MRVNTSESMKLARKVKGRFGTWQDVRAAARVENGVYIIESLPSSDEQEEHKAEQKSHLVEA